MALVELGRTVQGDTAPDRRDGAAQRGGAPEVAVGRLQVFKTLGVGPDHEVGVGPHAGHVVQTADHHTTILLLLEESRGLVDHGGPGVLVVTQHTGFGGEGREHHVANGGVELVVVQFRHGLHGATGGPA